VEHYPSAGANSPRFFWRRVLETNRSTTTEVVSLDRKSGIDSDRRRQGQMAKTLAAHRSGLLAYYDVMITSGPMEGTNHKIKAMERQA
jgi:hypothetical protein